MTTGRYPNRTQIDEFTFRLIDLAKNIAIVAEKNHKDYFIGSGLAVDFSVGNITRNHHDIDFSPMIEDYTWWKQWFIQQGYSIEEPVSRYYPDPCHVLNSREEVMVDMWPFKLTNGVLLINYKGNYVNGRRHWDELKRIVYEKVNVIIENPIRVLEQKARHIKKGEEIRPQDLHDFKLLGKTLNSKFEVI